MSFYKSLFIICLQFGLVAFSTAQTRIVRGIVRNCDDGSPLGGATVLEKGTTNEVYTDADGNFQLTIRYTTDTLFVSFIGKESEVLVVTGRGFAEICLYSVAVIPYSFSDEYPRLAIGYFGGYNYSPYGGMANYKFFLRPDQERGLTDINIRYKTNSHANSDFESSLQPVIIIIPKVLSTPKLSYRKQDMVVKDEKFKNETLTLLFSHWLPGRSKPLRYNKQEQLIWSLKTGITKQNLTYQGTLLNRWGPAARVKIQIPKIQLAITMEARLFKTDVQYNLGVHTEYSGFRYYERYINYSLEFERIRNYKEIKFTVSYILFHKPYAAT